MKLFTIPTLLGLSFGLIGTAMLAEASTRADVVPSGLEPLVSSISSVLDMTVNAAEGSQAPDLSNLLRVDAPDVELTFNNMIDRTVLSTHSIRKIGFGIETHVTIVRTPSGTYSSDGLRSNHVIYPGIDVTGSPLHQMMANRNGLVWNSTGGWVEAPRLGTPSLVTYTTTLSGGHVQVSGSHACIAEATFTLCN